MSFNLAAIVRTAWTLALLNCLGGCYLLQAAGGQVAVMAKRQPVEAVIQNPATAAELRSRLIEVGAARDFATRQLGLPDNGSYRQYADIGRRYVVWNVFATPPFSVEPRRWCFPIAGCVVYRGYFAEASAQGYAERLRSRGDDVAVGGVAAYSTLGHFADPILNTMLVWSDAQIAGTVFHELAHQLVYVQDDSAFNEAFASTVEEEGVIRWLTATGRLRELEAWQLQRRRAEDFSALLLGAREQLRQLYAQSLPAEDMNHRKQRILGELKFRYEQQRVSWGGYAGYDSWFARTLSNADLVSTATYRRCIPGFRRILESAGGDLQEFYRQVRALATKAPVDRVSSVCGGSA